MPGPDIQQEIMDRLERIKSAKKRPAYMAPKSYQDVMPVSLGHEKPDDSARYALLDQIDAQGRQATANALEDARQDELRKRMEKLQKQKERAKHHLQQAIANQPQFTGGSVQGGNVSITGGGGGGNFPTNGGDYGGYTGHAPSHVGVGQYLTTVHAGGFNFTVNKYVANRFVGFVNALVKRGYHPVSIGGYSNRNQANGSGLKSLHAYGLAIDIDPSRNPFTSGPAPHAIPNWAGALAAKYGLVWGGTWKHSKDYMHFSVPYGGRM